MGAGHGDTPSRLDRTLDGDRRTGARVAVWFRWTPQPSGNERLPCPGRHEATPSLRPGDAGLSRQSLGLLHLALEPRGLSFIFPGCLLILDSYAKTLFRPCSVGSKQCTAVIRESCHMSTQRPDGKVTQLCPFVLSSDLEALSSFSLDQQS